MANKSQRPLVNKLLAFDPITVDHFEYASLDDALEAMGTDISPERLAAALYDHAEVAVTVTTLYRWKQAIR